MPINIYLQRSRRLPDYSWPPLSSSAVVNQTLLLLLSALLLISWYASVEQLNETQPSKWKFMASPWAKYAIETDSGTDRQTRVVGICSHWECAACCLLPSGPCSLRSHVHLYSKGHSSSNWWSRHKKRCKCKKATIVWSQTVCEECMHECVLCVCVRCVYLANVINQFYAKISVHKFD